ncbi:MAG: FecR family protein [Parabacteroides sp.]
MNQQDDISSLLKQAKQLDADIREYQSIDVSQAWVRTWNRCGAPSRSRHIPMLLWRVAACLLFPFILSTILLGYLYYEEIQRVEPMAYVEAVAAPGLVTRIELPDSSSVWLNSGSRLRYPSRFEEKERLVELEGEGFFEVKADREHPFTVGVPQGMKVTAHGTKFNVSAYADDEELKTTLVNGVVDVKLGNQQVTLKPNEQARLNLMAHRLTLADVYVDEETAWREGRLVFRNTPLDEIMKKLSRKYNVDIELHCADPGKHTFRANFSTENVTQILDYLRMAAPIRWAFKPVEQRDDYTYPRQRIEVWVKDK